MKQFRTSNGSNCIICDDGYIRVISKFGNVYDGYINEDGSIRCLTDTPLERRVLINSYHFFKNLNL